MTGICKRGENPESLLTVESHFGWILTGPVDSYSKHTSAMLSMVENNEVTTSLKRFWSAQTSNINEGVDAKKILSMTVGLLRTFAPIATAHL